LSVNYKKCETSAILLQYIEICLLGGYYILHKKGRLPTRGGDGCDIAIFRNYSVRSATTGSRFAAMREGSVPAIRVRITLIATRMAAAFRGR